MNISWIPLTRLVVCLDCRGAFDYIESEACPKCGTEIGLASVRVTSRVVRKEKDEPETKPGPSA